jgi:hypothetical protein
MEFSTPREATTVIRYSDSMLNTTVSCSWLNRRSCDGCRPEFVEGSVAERREEGMRR